MKILHFKTKFVVPIILLLALLGVGAIFFIYPRIVIEKACTKQNPQSKFEKALSVTAGPNSLDCGVKYFQYPGLRDEQPANEDLCAIDALEHDQPYRFRRIIFGTDDKGYEGIAMNNRGEVFFIKSHLSMGQESSVDITHCKEITLYVKNQGQFMYCTGTFWP